jgi:hypothetical protein
MHLRYTADTHPDDLAFKETDNRKNFQGRYVLPHPWMGGDQCEAATSYRQHLVSRWEKESQTLANLTGWSINDIRAKQPSIKDAGSSNPWWEQMWQKK